MQRHEADATLIQPRGAEVQPDIVTAAPRQLRPSAHTAPTPITQALAVSTSLQARIVH